LASPEAKEEVMLHFLKFGDGVDQVRDVLGAEWANWRFAKVTYYYVGFCDLIVVVVYK
jgi:hypothetical protein